ncbi:SxtJ family membrane protein [Algibacter miyuki]|uniref:SxtJ family membrane protein n=1 Tax=Algibacter miyuki TaxID=1306933 RepID=A0ABV5GXV5_9FLAO|nr:SxtJ family membrane protein [Algibacter miyuki]MDN3664274.1 SxtJ family membrane protein [Algibacter miyuki]
MNWIKLTYSKVLNMSSTPKKQKEFGYLVLVVLLIALAMSFYKNDFSVNLVQAYCGLAMVITVVIMFFAKFIFKPFLVIWLLIGEVLGAVMSVLVMGVVYFLLFSPIAILMRIFNKKPNYKAEWKTVNRVIDYTKLG